MASLGYTRGKFKVRWREHGRAFSKSCSERATAERILRVVQGREELAAFADNLPLHTPSWWPQRPACGPGWVYFVQPEGDDRIKIGFSSRPGTRLRELQVGNGAKLRVLLLVPGTPLDEKLAHHALRRYRLDGEWFRADDVVYAFAARWSIPLP